MMPTRTFITRAPPLLRGRRRAALRGALISAGARPKAAATGLVSIKHANLKLHIDARLRRSRQLFATTARRRNSWAT
jgi:hypothetical protein